MMSENSYSYIKTNVLPPNRLLPVIFGVVSAGMSFMFICFALGVPLLVIIILFLIIMFGGVFSAIYTGEYWLYEDGLEEKLAPKIKGSPFSRPRHTKYLWADLDTYLLDADASSGTERKYLKLYFNSPKRSVVIGEGDKDITQQQFADFTLKFAALLQPAHITKQTLDMVGDAQPIAGKQQSTAKPFPAGTIRAKPRTSFYDKPAGKITTVLLCAFTAVAIIVYLFPGIIGAKEFSASNSWRVWAVLVPGCIYMASRSFRKKT